MSDIPSKTNARVVALLLMIFVVGGSILYFSQTDGRLRGGTMKELLTPFAEGKDLDKATVARAILGNYTETRQIAALWSGLYWGFTWAAAVLGALSGLILKLESCITDEKIKKDIAAFFTVSAAIMITVSTGGEFQRKWQANRTAAATIEEIGYDFLSHKGENAYALLPRVRDALKQRHLSILGTLETDKSNSAPNSTDGK
mgnify:CR=1 FL=1|jgi:hypothetical protein